MPGGGIAPGNPGGGAIMGCCGCIGIFPCCGGGMGYCAIGAGAADFGCALLGALFALEAAGAAGPFGALLLIPLFGWPLCLPGCCGCGGCGCWGRGIADGWLGGAADDGIGIGGGGGGGGAAAAGVNDFALAFSRVSAGAGGFTAGAAGAAALLLLCFPWLAAGDAGADAMDEGMV